MHVDVSPPDTITVWRSCFSIHEISCATIERGYLLTGEPDLLSFAAITDDPPPEIAAAGHERCIIPIKAENVAAWFNPDPKYLTAQYAILDDRERPYYEHRLAA